MTEEKSRSDQETSTTIGSSILLRHQGFMCLNVCLRGNLGYIRPWLTVNKTSCERKVKRIFIRKEKTSQWESNQCILARYFNAKLSYPNFQSSAAHRYQLLMCDRVPSIMPSWPRHEDACCVEVTYSYVRSSHESCVGRNRSCSSW